MGLIDDIIKLGERHAVLMSLFAMSGILIGLSFFFDRELTAVLAIVSGWWGLVIAFYFKSGAD